MNMIPPKSKPSEHGFSLEKSDHREIARNLRFSSVKTIKIYRFLALQLFVRISMQASSPGRNPRPHWSVPSGSGGYSALSRFLLK
jgi:hypothetical protein